MSSLRTSAATGVMWSAVQIWTVRLTTAGAFIVLSRQLQPNEFGLVALAMAVIAVLSLFGDSGIPVYVQRAEEIDKPTLDTAFWTTVALGTVLAGALALLAVPVAALFDAPGLTPVLQVLSIGLVLNSLNSIQSALLKRQMRFKTLAIRGTIATLIGSAVAITMALNGFGVWALVTQSLVRSGVSVIIIWTSVSWYPGFSWSRKRAKEMIGFGSKLLTISLLMTLRDRGEDFLLAGLSGTGVLGLWSVANRLVRIIQETGSSVVSSVATPAFAKLQGEPKRLYRAYETSMVATSSIMFPALSLLAVISPVLVPTVLGQQWQQTAEAAQIIALTAIVGVFVYFDRPVFIAFNRLRPEIILVAFIVAAHLTIVVLVAPLGLNALALALLGRSLVTWPIRMVVLHRSTGVPYRSVLRPLRVLAAAGVMAGAVVLALTIIGDGSDWLKIGVSVGVAALVYPAALLLLARSVVLDLMSDVKRVRRPIVLPESRTEEVRDVEVSR